MTLSATERTMRATSRRGTPRASTKSPPTSALRSGDPYVARAAEPVSSGAQLGHPIGRNPVATPRAATVDATSTTPRMANSALCCLEKRCLAFERTHSLRRLHRLQYGARGPVGAPGRDMFINFPGRVFLRGTDNGCIGLGEFLNIIGTEGWELDCQHPGLVPFCDRSKYDIAASVEPLGLGVTVEDGMVGPVDIEGPCRRGISRTLGALPSHATIAPVQVSRRHRMVVILRGADPRDAQVEAAGFRSC